MEPEREGCFYGRPGIFLEEAFSIAVYGRRLLWRMKGRALLLAGETFRQRSQKGRETGKTGERHLAAGPFREAGKAGYMAKAGIDYFPLNCRLDEKFELIEAEYGLKGFAVIVKLLQRIYGEHGYYCEWNDDIALLLRGRSFPAAGQTI